MRGWSVPASVDDLAAILEAEPKATIVAGSTDVGLWVTKHMRDISPAVFIGNLDGLQEISEEGGMISIGAGVTYTEAFALLSKRIPALGPLIDRIGGEQVRNMGTIGGNIANGSPIGDMPPPLIALGATVTLRKGKKRRTMPLEEFFIAYGKQDRQPGEFVETVHVPVPAKGAKFAVYKITKRRDEDITAALGAFHLTLAKNGTVAKIRIAYGGMAATPKRAAAVETALIGKPWTDETVEAALGAYATDFTPLTDMRASAEYRALAAKNLLLRFFAETAGGKAPMQVSRAGGSMNKHASPNLKAAKINGGVATDERHDSAHKHVTGEAIYIDDMPEPAGTLHGCLGLSTVAHGTIRTIDLSAVRSAPGVVDVLTGRRRARRERHLADRPP